MASTLSSSSLSAFSLQSSRYNAGLRRLSIRPPSSLTFRSPRHSPFNVKALSAPTLTQDDLKKLAADKAVPPQQDGLYYNSNYIVDLDFKTPIRDGSAAGKGSGRAWSVSGHGNCSDYRWQDGARSQGQMRQFLSAGYIISSWSYSFQASGPLL
ncbi:hypothetical protein SAY86_007369 [Trapa natans]|uniref:Uncharacterized protein n=1 Tax=Trapa natans TaxID=22666 RepID=A0AAN7LL70_TRANT|nr:hypothetical protein SAY86_007369 [Trapa natans]